MGEQAPLGAVSAHVPGGACGGIKVIVPVLVKSVVGVGYSVDQAVVQHLWGVCSANTAVSDCAGLCLALTPARQQNAVAPAYLASSRDIKCKRWCMQITCVAQTVRVQWDMMTRLCSDSATLVNKHVAAAVRSSNRRCRRHKVKKGELAIPYLLAEK